MKKCVFVVTYVDKSSVQSRHQFLDFTQVDIAQCERNVAGLFLQLDQPLVVEQRDGYLFGLYVYD